MEPFGKINRESMYDQIAERIERMILDESLKVGDKLPSEYDLAERFGVSRNILREAFKTLKGRGLIAVRSGSGAVVTKPKPAVLCDTINRFVRLNDVSIADVYEARLALEVSSAGLAAERASEEDFTALEQILESMKAAAADAELWPQLELAFHTRLAQASGNPILMAFIQSLAGLLGDLFATGLGKPKAPREGLRGHAAIVKAICTRDPKAAEKAMLQHLSRSRHLIMENGARD